MGLSGRFNAASAAWDLAIGSAKIRVKVMVAAANHRVRVNRVDLNPAARTYRFNRPTRAIAHERVAILRSGTNRDEHHAAKNPKSSPRASQGYPLILLAKPGIRPGNDGIADEIKRDVARAGLFAGEKGLSCQEWKNHRGIRIWQSTRYMFN
jgi:hypothetical protein